MHWFLILARPTEDNKEVDDEVAGAYISAWINFPEIEAAEVIAKHYISESDWRISRVLESRWVTEESYEDSDEIEYYNEALEHGSSLVFHTWTKDAEDSEMDYEATIQ